MMEAASNTLLAASINFLHNDLIISFVIIGVKYE